MTDAPAQDLDIKYRPARLEDVVGQPDAVKAIRGFGLHPPRAILLDGPAGCGKTTLARIIATMFDVTDWDLNEVNCGVVESSIDMVRDINRNMTAASMKVGGRRMWILDEVQTLSRQKFAQEALLKVLEDGPPHVLFALCTTDPKRLLPAIRTRCIRIGVSAVEAGDLAALVARVAAAEQLTLHPKVADRIVAAAEGSARVAVKLLQKVAGLPPADQQAAVVPPRAETQAFALVKKLLPFKDAPSWKEVAAVLTEIKDEDPEGIRMMVLASARTSLLKDNNAPLAYRVIKALSDPFYDRSSGHALLAAGCYLACNGVPK